MTFESWDDVMFWHGSLIGYMAGVKSACKDEDKSHLLLRMADTQARLEFMESENAKLRELVRSLHMAYIGALNEAEGMDAGIIWEYSVRTEEDLAKSHAKYEADRHRFDAEMRELGVEVDKR